MDKLAELCLSIHASSLGTQENLPSGADVRDIMGRTRLHLAAEQRNGVQLRMQVELCRQNVNRTDYNGNTPLHLLLSSNSNIKNNDTLESLVQILLDNGANIEATNNEKQTPLHTAIAHGWIQPFKLLLEYRANWKSRNIRGFGVLHYLAGSPDNAPVCAKMLQILLDLGCDINAKSYDERTPLCIALYAEHNICFNLLIEHGANLLCKDAIFGTTILHIAAKCSKDHVVRKLMRILNERDPCEKDAMVNAKLKDGRTALHLATRHHHTYILKSLLRNDADVESVDSNGRTALHYACQHNNIGAINMLIDFGADMSVKDDYGFTPMMLNEKVESVMWRRVVMWNAPSIAIGLPAVDFHRNLITVMQKTGAFLNYKVEIVQMKRTMINSQVSVYDLLLNEKKMYKYRNNAVFKEILYFGRQFPSYKQILFGKYRKVCRKGDLVALATKALLKMTGYSLESTLSYMIFEHLSNSELHDFIEAAARDDLG